MQFRRIKSSKGGFTLIEMLVVVAIIGLLSSVILTALGPAKNKAKDARIMQEVNQVRSLAETMYNGTYAELPELPAQTIANPNLSQLAADITSEGGALNIIKSSDQRTYLAFSQLTTTVTDPTTQTQVTQYYCVDSSGHADFLMTPPDYNQVKSAPAAVCQ